MKPQTRYQPGDRIGGRYQVHKALMGGMGEVYLCLDLEKNYPYALKTFQQRYVTDDQRLRRAFEQEVTTWVALEKHPNIVRCFHMDTLDNQPFMVLEWIAGKEGRGADLRSWLRRGPLELKLALEIAIDICRGLIHAQEKHPDKVFVHRDLKPENILMDQDGLAKITDFGLAQIVQAAELELNQEGAEAGSRQSFVGGNGVAGTPAYMAPEQWRREDLDMRTDIYALGCMLYEMVTGRLPFVSDGRPTTPEQQQSWLAAMQAAHERTPAPGLPAGVAAGLDAVVHGCLAKTRGARPATLAEMVSQLTQLYGQCFAQMPPVRPTQGVFSAIDYNNRGITYYALQQYEVALTDYSKAIALDPTYAKAYANQGAAYAELGQGEEALGNYSQAIALDPTYAQAYYNRGVIYADLERHKVALDDYSMAIALDPTLVQAYFNRGLTYQVLQQQEAALADFNKALTLEPTDAQAYFNRGNTYHELQQYKVALGDYSQAIALEPTDAQAYFNRGMTYAELQQYEAALADYSHALALDPTLAQAYVGRGNTYKALQRHRAALADYSQALTLDPTLAQAYYNRGITYYVLQQYEAALADYSQALALDPTLAQAYSNRGLTYQALQQQEAALADYSQALALDPTLATAYVNIGALLGNAGKQEEALRFFEQAARLDDATGVQYAAQARRKLGQEEAPAVEPGQAAFMAFVEADSLAAMRQAGAHYPLLRQTEFIALMEQVTREQVPPEQQPALQARLVWLRQIADSQHSRSTQ